MEYPSRPVMLNTLAGYPVRTNGVPGSYRALDLAASSSAVACPGALLGYPVHARAGPYPGNPVLSILQLSKRSGPSTAPLTDPAHRNGTPPPPPEPCSRQDPRGQSLDWLCPSSPKNEPSTPESPQIQPPEPNPLGVRAPGTTPLRPPLAYCTGWSQPLLHWFFSI